MSDRWVCKRCFADNEDGDTACVRCGMTRGAEATPDDQAAWAASDETKGGSPNAGWRRWIRFWWVPAIAIGLLIGYASSARRGDDGALTSQGSVGVAELRIGDCFNADDAEELADVEGVPCSMAHEYEVFALATYEGDGAYPPDSALEGIFYQVCEPKFEPYVGTPWQESEIYGSMISPSEESWGSGDRSFVCVLFDPDNTALTESLAGADR